MPHTSKTVTQTWDTQSLKSMEDWDAPDFGEEEPLTPASEVSGLWQSWELMLRMPADNPESIAKELHAIRDDLLELARTEFTLESVEPAIHGGKEGYPKEWDQARTRLMTLIHVIDKVTNADHETEVSLALPGYLGKSEKPDVEVIRTDNGDGTMDVQITDVQENMSKAGNIEACFLSIPTANVMQEVQTWAASNGITMIGEAVPGRPGLSVTRLDDAGNRQHEGYWLDASAKDALPKIKPSSFLIDQQLKNPPIADHVEECRHFAIGALHDETSNYSPDEAYDVLAFDGDSLIVPGYEDGVLDGYTITIPDPGLFVGEERALRTAIAQAIALDDTLPDGVRCKAAKLIQETPWEEAVERAQPSSNQGVSL